MKAEDCNKKWPNPSPNPPLAPSLTESQKIKMEMAKDIFVASVENIGLIGKDAHMNISMKVEICCKISENIFNRISWK